MPHELINIANHFKFCSMKSISSTKIFHVLSLGVIIFFLTACNGVSIKPVSSKINGDFGKYFEVVDKNYSIRNNKFSVEFKKIAECGSDVIFLCPFTVDLLDGNGNVLETSDCLSIDSESIHNLEKLEVGETSMVTITFNASMADQLQAAQFKVRSN